jgi:hypothetical protein
VVYTVLLGVNVLFLMAGCTRWFREMGALAKPGARPADQRRTR